MGNGGGGETMYEVTDSRVLPQHDEDWYAWRISRQVLPVEVGGDGDVAYAEAHNLGENVFTGEASDEFAVLKDENVTIVLDLSGGEADRVILVNYLE